MEKIQERLLYLVDKFSNGNLSVFAKKAKIPQSTMHKYINGRIPNGEALFRIHNTFGINLNWLLTGKGGEDIKKDYCLLSESKENYSHNTGVFGINHNNISIINGEGSGVSGISGVRSAEGMKHLADIIASGNNDLINLAIHQLAGIAGMVSKRKSEK